jgi:hypothetical protein
MDLSGTAKAQALSIEQSQEDARHQVLNSITGTLAAVKRLVAAYDRVKGERDNFERQLASTLIENEVLRKQTKEAQHHRDHFSEALTTLTEHMDAIGARCKEAVKIARTQPYDQAATTLANTPPTGRPNSAEQPTMPGGLAAARAETNDQASPKPLPAESRRPDEEPAARSTLDAAHSPTTDVQTPADKRGSASFQAFAQYLAQ